ncbi:MAG: phenylalanine--tRNA ligase subunit alpha [Candidatus Sericytochromatia bacterium]|nr:phenylalanine--tRNA ligase subunit alpha [Candidatus Sericytochromatia bacterium]
MTTAQEALGSLEHEALLALDGVEVSVGLEAWQTEFLGRERGRVTQALKAIPSLLPEERKPYGAAVNRIKVKLEEALELRRFQLRARETAARIASEALDVSMPPVGRPAGHAHVLGKVRDDLVALFRGLGYTLAEGPEVEDAWHNFSALNTPEDHPARDPRDTFYLPDGLLLRTQTSSVQIRHMKAHRPPIRIIAPGRVYRRDAVTPRHFPMFHQLEGLHVDEGISFAHLKGVLQAFADGVFGPGTVMRLRPSFFPFTEPSAEMDVRCVFCGGEGCRICSQTGWLEILGCGMVDPAVLESVHIDAERYSGFAFGLGIERIAMLRHRIPDIRLLWENDPRFLSQF